MNNNNMDNEVWKDVVGYEEYYQVSSKGMVRSVDRIVSNNKVFKGKLLKQREDKAGYLDIMLSKGGKGKRFKVHRLVAIAFIDNPNEYPQVNHKDEDKKNNAISNLEWCDNSYNQTYGTMVARRKLQGIERGTAVYAIDIKGNVTRFDSIKSASLQLNVFRSGIYDCLKGKAKSYKGFTFEYA